MAVQPIIVDCDPGIDDALALLLALSAPEAVDTLAITTAGGNGPVAATTRNALRVLDFARRTDVPVHAGVDPPALASPKKTSAFHGADGLGNCGWPEPSGAATAIPATTAIVETVMALPPASVTLCALAPLTNIAQALAIEPRLARRLKALRIMGGSLSLPTRAEFNFRSDPDAAHKVLTSGARIRLFDIDATTRAPIAGRLLTAMRACPAIDKGVFTMVSHYAESADSIHDICPVAALIEPRIATFERQSVMVERQDPARAGQCRIGGNGPEIEIAAGLDKDAILALAKGALLQT